MRDGMMPMGEFVKSTNFCQFLGIPVNRSSAITCCPIQACNMPAHCRPSRSLPCLSWMKLINTFKYSIWYLFLLFIALLVDHYLLLNL